MHVIISMVQSIWPGMETHAHALIFNCSLHRTIHVSTWERHVQHHRDRFQKFKISFIYE